QRADISPSRDNAAFPRAMRTDPEPGTVLKLQDFIVSGSAMGGKSLLDPRFGITVLYRRSRTPFYQPLHQRFERHADHELILELQELPAAIIERDEPVSLVP